MNTLNKTKINTFVLISILAFLNLAPVSAAWGQKLSAKVIAVEKGNVIEVLHKGKTLKISLYGIDCPKIIQLYGQKAQKFTSRTALNQSVLIEIHKHQSDTLYIGNVILPDGTNLNQSLLKKGLATWDRQNAPDNIKFQSLESIAKDMGVGIWAHAVTQDTDSAREITPPANNIVQHEKTNAPTEKTQAVDAPPMIITIIGILIIFLTALLFIVFQYKKNQRKKSPQKFKSKPIPKSNTIPIRKATEEETRPYVKQAEETIESNKRTIQALLNNLSDFVTSLVESNSTYTTKMSDHKDSIKTAITQAGVEEIKRLLLLELDQMQVNSNKYREQLRQANGTINEQQKIMEEIQLDAKIDALTKLTNRRAFDECLKEEFERAKRYGGTFSLAMLDIDFFKEVNDTYGHLAGDKTLQLFSKLFREQTRVHDSIGRFGGDEFIILLPQTSVDKAGIVMEKIRQKVQANTIMYDGDKIKVTISVGVGEIDLPAETIKNLIARVDAALYRAKESGRNRVMTAAIDKAPIEEQMIT